MGNMRNDRREDNPLLQVYMKIIPAMIAAIVVIFLLVKLISGIIAPDHLILDVTYNDYEQGAVLKTPIRVAKDAAFEKEVKSMSERKSGFMDVLTLLENTAEKPEELAALDAQEAPKEEETVENGTYRFAYENTKLPDTIYVKSPEWWYPVNTQGDMTMPLEVGAKIDLLKDVGPLADVSGEAVFEITNIETVKISTGIFNISVSVTAAGKSVPSNVKLVMGDEVFEEWDGSTELVYDKETGFADRTIVFRYNRSLREDISDLLAEAVVVVEEFTVHRQFRDCEIVSNIEGLEIVQVED